MIAELTPTELRTARVSEQAPVVIDVREPWEYSRGHIAGSEHIPLKDLAHTIMQKHPDKEKQVVVCSSIGVRSQHAATLLRALGYKNAIGLEGGIGAYARLAES